MFEVFLHKSLVGFGLSFIWIFVAWLLYVIHDNGSIIDIFWGHSLYLYAFAHLALDNIDSREYIILWLVVLWAVRLSGYLLYRIWGRPEEGRYKKLRDAFGSKVKIKFFFFFQGQNLFNLFIAITFFGISLGGPKDSALFYLASFLVLVGILGESIADLQLELFKRNPKNKGSVCRVGLWNLSRHPNYFFETLVWVGFGTFALQAPGFYKLTALVAPGLILFTLLRVTGIPATEAQALRSRGEQYAKYQREVPMFIPWKSNN